MHYFIEHLPRLSTTTVYVSLNRNDVKTTNLIDNCLIINENIKLPINTNISPTDEFDIITSPEGDSYTCIRVRVRTRTLLSNDQTTIDSLTDDKYQWNSKTLSSMKQSAFLCGKCSGTVISLNKISKVLPMPSELWYEMLDYWHCHKPDEEDKHSKNVKYLKKFNSLKPLTNGIIVGPHYFIVNPEDWDKLKVVNTQLQCGSCGNALGELDDNFGNYKLLKWNVTLSSNDEVEKYNKYSYVTIKLLEEINYSAVRQFVLSCNDIKIKVWCFGVGIDICLDDVKIPDCLKVLYTDYKKDMDASIPVLEIEYEDSLVEFIERLNEMNSRLPLPIKDFKSWSVSYMNLE